VNSKYTIEIVKEYIKKEGYKCLSVEYRGAKFKLKVECDKGHKYEVTFDNFKNRGQRCRICYGTGKLTYKYVKNYIESFGYKLLATEYKASRFKLRMECDKGHRFEMIFNNFKSRGQRCRICSFNKLKLTNRYVKNYIKSFGYKLLSEYINIKTKIKIECNKGHKYKVTFNGFHNHGQRCPICSDRKYTYKYVKNYIESFGYKLLSTKYERGGDKLKIECDKGHKYKATFFNFKHYGQRCRICWLIKNSGEGHSNWKGGISCEPYCDVWTDKEYKESIKLFHNYTCQNEDCRGTSKRLCLHHINYNKKDCEPKNLITICNSCNARANYNRKEWQKYYKNRIKEIKKGKILKGGIKKKGEIK